MQNCSHCCIKEKEPETIPVTEIWYKDSDGDGFGDLNNKYIGEGEPDSGYVKNNKDCYDSNADAKPGQTNFFGVHRGDDSFDYDCNGVSQREHTQKGECSDGTADQGWEGDIPSPGQTGNWLVDCDRIVKVFPPKIEIVRETERRVQKGR